MKEGMDKIKITCEVASDLLPLYHDEVCSDDSRKLVENHLRDCMNCRSLLKKIESDCCENQKQEQDKEHLIVGMAGVWKKTVLKSFIKGAVAAVIVLFGLFAVWFLTNWPLVQIPPEDVKASIEVDGSRFTVSLDTSNPYKVPSPDMAVTEDGKLYFTLKHALVPVKRGEDADYGGIYACPMEMETKAGNMVRVKAVYYGDENDCVLLWESGD